MKQRAQIITVDRANRRVEVRLKDGGTFPVQVWETPAFFRWPRQDEYWTIERAGTYWTLGHPIENTEGLGVSDLGEGQARIDTDEIYTPSGSRLVSMHTGPVAPANPQTPELWFKTTDHKLYCYDGTAWQACW